MCVRNWCVVDNYGTVMRVIKKNEGGVHEGERGPEGNMAWLFASAWRRRYARSFRAGAAVCLT